MTTKINEGIRVREANTCFLCRNKGVLLYQNLTDRIFNTPGIWSLMYCPKCELTWLNPQPVPSDINKLYVDYFTHKKEEEIPKKRFNNLRKAIKSIILKHDLGYHVSINGSILAWFLSRVGPIKEIVEASVMYIKAKEKGILLDVGCGNGQFLIRMRELGWKVMGVEPDLKAVQIAREYFGLDIFQGTLKEANFSDNSFDAITMNHVIEHVLDPIELLTECYRILKPSGKLVLITPNTKSLGRRLFGKNWLHWDPPRHIFLFTPKSLRACVEKVGFRIEKLATISRGAQSTWHASYLIWREGKLQGKYPPKINLKLKLVGGIFWIIEYISSYFGDLGEEIVLVAEKRK